MGAKDIPAFLDSIPNDKLCNWSDGQHTIYKDRNLGFRLDHQGKNQDGTHRIYIHPIAGGKGTHSKNMSSSAVVARTNVASPGIPENVRNALKESAKGKARLAIADA